MTDEKKKGASYTKRDVQNWIDAWENAVKASECEAPSKIKGLEKALDRTRKIDEAEAKKEN